MGDGDNNKGFWGRHHLGSVLAATVAIAVVFASLFFASTLGGGLADGGGGSPAAPAEQLAALDGGAVLPPATAFAADHQVTGEDNGAKQDESGSLFLNSYDAAQDVAIPATLADGQTASVRYDNDTGVPAFLTGAISPAAAGAASEQALGFFELNKDLYRMSEPAGELVVKRESEDDLAMDHVRLAQVYRGVPVFGADLAVHFSPDGKIKAVNGRYLPGLSLAVEPVLAAGDAVAIAQQDLGQATVASDFEPTGLTILGLANREPLLTWKVTLNGAEGSQEELRAVYFIDAGSGAVAAKYDALEDARSRNTYTADNGTSLPGRLLVTEGGSTADGVAQTAHNNAGLTYDYYFNTFGRNSFNGGGATISSTVHYGSRYNNAFWNGQQMVYGDGDGNVFAPLGNALDVVAHELTHAVTQYSAGLIYSYQSGALNESYSDVFGAMVDRNDWDMGEDVYSPNTPGDALRSLSDPTRFGQPAHMNSYVNTSSDNGGVHTNSGIPNKAAYNIATAIGKDKMERIWYRTLTVYLGSSAEFVDARDASVQAAADLYGSPGAEVTAVQNGFAAVGVGGAQTSDTTARIEIDHTYRGDLVVTLGVGNPNSPTWSTTISNRAGGSADNLYTTVDISAGAGYLPPDWQNRWFLKVSDAAGYDTGQIRKFAITDHGTTYTATDVPLPIYDYQTAISYLPTADDTPPTLASTSPAAGVGGVYNSANVYATFSERMANLSSSNFRVTRHSDGSAVAGRVSFDNNSNMATFDPAADFEPMTAYDAVVTSDVTDLAGNHLAANYNWSFTTGPPPKRYYFSWYDMANMGLRDWLVMGNPSSNTVAAGFDIYIGNAKANVLPLMAQPGQTQPITFAGAVGGPVKLLSLGGTDQIVSKRTLYGNSFEEINALDENRLDSHYYFTWYDARSLGARNWVLVANPGATAVEADIYIAGNKMNGSPYRIEANGTVAPEYRGIMGGPVEIIAHEPGNPSLERDVIVSQRVIWQGNFNEVMGIPASELTNDYFFTWYDQQSRGATNWVLVTNPNSSQKLAAEIWIGGQKMTNSASGDQYFEVEPGQTVTPSFPGIMNGPVEVKGYDAAGYNPANPGSPNLNFFATQRVLFGSSFGETVGFGANRLSTTYYNSWYDQLSPGSRNWVLVSNPGSSDVKVEVWIAGVKRSVLTIAPGATQTPSYNGLMGGPVEVRGYDAASYNPSSPGRPNRNIFTSQRVLWNGNFNEVEGMVLP